MNEDESVTTAEDIVIVNAGMHAWGVERDKLFAALDNLGWQHRLERWHAPLKPRAKLITAARRRSPQSGLLS